VKWLFEEIMHKIEGETYPAIEKKVEAVKNISKEHISSPER